MSQYAQLSDITRYGLPGTALGTLTSDQQTQALVDASAEIDSYLGGRYSLPLVTWDIAVTKACVVIATWNLLSVRGFNPNNGADASVRMRYTDAIAWLRQVQNQQAHPNVTPTATSVPSVAQPTVISSSVVDLASGCTAPTRGW